MASAYVAGSASTAYYVARLLGGVDIRERGRRNAGALNVFREVGGWAGAAVLAIDAAKGAAVVLVVTLGDLGDATMFFAGIALLVGHNHPLFLGFRGGKGVAVIFGLSMAVLPLMTVISSLLAVAFGLASRNVVFGIGAGFVALNVLTIATGQDASQIAVCLTLSAIVVATHFALSYRDVIAAVKTRGVWGLFEAE